MEVSNILKLRQTEIKTVASRDWQEGFYADRVQFAGWKRLVVQQNARA